jgi:hypothetical protein
MIFFAATFTLSVSGPLGKNGESTVIISPTVTSSEPKIVTVFLKTYSPEMLDPPPMLVLSSKNSTHFFSNAAPDTKGNLQAFNVCLAEGRSNLMVSAFWSTTTEMASVIQIANITLTDVGCVPSSDSGNNHCSRG